MMDVASDDGRNPWRPENWRQERVLVTGGSGHLGANLVRRLIDEGCQVRALARPGSNNAALDGLDLELFWGDLRDLTSLQPAVEGCTYVFHCAARLSTVPPTIAEKHDIFDTNVLGTRNLLLASTRAGVKRVVVTGSLSATGYDRKDPSLPASEDAPFFPFADQLPYEHSKALVEHECLKAFAEHGLDVVVATSCAIIGPNDFKPSRMGLVLCDFARGKLRAYIPGGFEFVSTRDIVQGHVLALERGRAGQKYIFSTRFLTVDELLDYFEEVTGRNKPKLRLPPPLMAGIAEVTSFVMNRLFPTSPQRLTPGAVRLLRMQRHADCGKAKEQLGYQPTSILEVIHAAYEDFVRRGVIPRTRSVAAVGKCFDDPEASAWRDVAHEAAPLPERSGDTIPEEPVRPSRQERSRQKRSRQKRSKGRAGRVTKSSSTPPVPGNGTPAGSR